MGEKELFLIYINKIGTNFKGEYFYEFLFSEKTDWDWPDEWYGHTVITENGVDYTPPIESIKEAGLLKTDKLNLDLVQELGIFNMYSAVEGIIALAWEKLNEEDDYPEERIVFKFGDTKKSVEDKLYSLDLILSYTKK